MAILREAVAVYDVTNVRMDQEAPELSANLWQVVYVPYRRPGTSRLLCYWQSEELSEDHYWVYRQNGIGWVFVKKIEDCHQDSGKVKLYPYKVNGYWRYSVDEYVDGVIIILPHGVAAAETDPRAQATLKRDRLMLFFTRPSEEAISWTPTVDTYSVADHSSLKKVVGELNRAYQRDVDAQRAARESSVKLVDPAPRAQQDRTGTLVSLWIGIVTCVGVFVAAAALAHGLIMIGGMAFGAIATVITVVWLIQVIRSRPGRQAEHAGNAGVIH